MYWLGLSVQLICIVVQLVILALMFRRKLCPRFPIFATYVAYVIVQMILRSVFLSNRRVYFYVFWITAPVEMILAILAVHESFLKVFRSFYLLWWFRILLPGAIVGTLAYSGWRGYVSPPVRASAAAAAIISAALTAQYIILAMAFVFFGLAMFLHVPLRIHEYRFVLGFAISSLGVAFGGTVRSVFGTNFRFLSEMLPAAVYLFALLVWLSAVVHAHPSNERVLREQVSGEQMISELRRQSQLIRAFLRKG